MLKRNIAHTTYTAMLLLLGGTAAMAQSKHEFSVKQCVEFAHKNSVQVKNALLDLKIQEQVNRGVTSAALPNISASGSITDNLKIATQLLPGEFFGQPAGTFVPVRFGTKFNAFGGLALNQLLFDGQVFVGLQARRASIEFRQKNVEVTEEAIKKNVYKVYYQLVVAKTQIQLLDANIDRLTKLQHDVKEIYKNGFAEKLDVDKIEVQLANLNTQKEKVLGSIDQGYLGLKVLMGMPVKDTLILTDAITDTDLKQGLLEDVKYQYTDRKEYQYLTVVSKLNEYNVKRYKLSYIPTLSLAANYSYNAQRTKFDFTQRSVPWFPNAFVSLKLNIPIFDGFAKDANLQQAKLALMQTRNQLDDLKQVIDNDVERSNISYRTAIRTIDVQKKNMQLAEQVYEQTKKKYEAGLGSNTEITAAQTDLVQAQTNYISAIYDAIIARVDHLAAIGKL